MMKVRCPNPRCRTELSIPVGILKAQWYVYSLCVCIVSIYTRMLRVKNTKLYYKARLTDSLALVHFFMPSCTGTARVAIVLQE